MSSRTEDFRYTSAPERRERVVQFIAEQGYCTTAELSRAFSVSEMTIRRDVQRLVEQGRVRGFRGGVGSVGRADLKGSDYSSRDSQMSEAKRAIALTAVEMVRPGSAIALDAGTTTSQVADLLPSDRDVKVVTHSYPVVAALLGNAGAEVVCLGGNLHPESLSFDGPATLAAISNLQIETLFLAASGMSERGIFCANGFDAVTKRALIEASDQVVLLADSSKFYDSAMVRVCDWQGIDRLVVDDAISEEHERMLTEHGVEIMKVRTTAPSELIATEAGA